MKYFIISVLLSIITFTQTISYYEGKIGKFPILLKIEKMDKNNVYITYSYQKFGKDIILYGTQTNNNITASTDYYNENNEAITIKKNINNKWSGQWKKDKKTLSIQLEELDLNLYANNYDKTNLARKLKIEDPYSYAKLKNIILTEEKITNYNKDISLIWYKEKYSDISFFRVLKGYNSIDTKNINQMLETEQLSLILDSYTCPASESESDFYSHITPTFFNQNLLHANIVISYYCGGAHPDFTKIPLAFNIKEQKKLSLEDIIIFNSDKTIDKYEYQSKIFAPTVFNLLKEIYPDEIYRISDDENEMPYNNESVWNSNSWSISPKGIHFGAYFPRIARCYDNPEWSIIPYEYLEKYLTPEFKALIK